MQKNRLIDYRPEATRGHIPKEKVGFPDFFHEVLSVKRHSVVNSEAAQVKTLVIPRLTEVDVHSVLLKHNANKRTLMVSFGSITYFY